MSCSCIRILPPGKTTTVPGLETPLRKTEACSAGREEPVGRPNKGPGEAGGSEHLFHQSDPLFSLDYDPEKEALHFGRSHDCKLTSLLLTSV